MSMAASTNRWRRYDAWDERPLHLDRLAAEDPENGFCAANSPFDPTPSLVLADGEVVEHRVEHVADLRRAVLREVVVAVFGVLGQRVLAEHFRDRGKHVLLLMDSLTRYAMAHREMALALGEPPATKGYPPSVFARLPQLVERTGNGLNGCGSITAFYTVLAEGDDQQDPIADNARAILDGHFVLTRSLAEQGHYPAIDIEQSISRVMHNVTDDAHLRQARALKALYARYQRNRDLLAVGAYVPGGDPQTDRAIQLYPQVAAFLQQDMREGCSLQQSTAALQAMVALAGNTAQGANA